MPIMVHTLNDSAKYLEEDHYSVSDDWTVRDIRDYASEEQNSKGDAAALSRIATARRLRSEEAINETIRLQGLARELHTVDVDTARAIREAADDIRTLAPVTAGLSVRQAEIDLKSWQDGHPTPAALARLRAATTLTPEQMGLLQTGRDAVLGQGQFDYMQKVMSGLSGLGFDQMLAIDGTAPGLLGDAFRVMGNPKVVGRSGERAGMHELPDNVRGLLQGYPLGVETNYDSNTRSAEFIAGVPRLGDFEALNKMLSSGNQSLRLGTDVDRGLLKQASEISRLYGPDRGPEAFGQMPERGPYFSVDDDPRIRSVMNSMLANASGDHQSVASFLTGDGMNVTTLDGQKYDVDRHILDLTKVQWKDGEGHEALIDWIGDNAGDSGHEGKLAGQSAKAWADFLIRNHHELSHIGESGPGEATEAMGTRSPELTRALTRSLIPYMGNFVDLDDSLLLNHEAGSLSTTGDMAQMIGLLSTDRVSAEALVHGVARWENFLAYQHGMDPRADWGLDAGQLNAALSQGLDLGSATLKENHDWQETLSYAERARQYDMATNLLRSIPAGGLGGFLYNAAGAELAPAMKDSIVGYQGDPRDIETEQLGYRDELRQTYVDLTRGPAQNFFIVDGVAENRPDLWGEKYGDYRGQTPVEYFDSEGNPNWQAIKSDPRRFEDFLYSKGIDIDEYEDSYRSDHTEGEKNTRLNDGGRPAPDSFTSEDHPGNDPGN